MEIPKHLFHGTYRDEMRSILVEGLKPIGPDRKIYMTDSPDDAARFGRRRQFATIDPEEVGKLRAIGDTEAEMKLIDKHNRGVIVYVLVIDSSYLKPSKVAIGEDHNPAVYKAIVFTYEEIIPPEAVLGVFEIDMELAVEIGDVKRNEEYSCYYDRSDALFEFCDVDIDE